LISEFQGITVVADEQVLKGLSTHVFNNLLWPDFTSIPDREKAVIRYQILDGHYTTVAGLRVKPVPVQHSVHTTGFIIQENDKSIMLTSDTGATEQFWHTARLEPPDLIIAHVAFPSRLADRALTSGHMTPSMLLERIDAYNLHDVSFYIAHMKSMFEREIREEIKQAGRQNLRVLKQGSVLYA
jgi:cAMP phosphodiesterase